MKHAPCNDCDDQHRDDLFVLMEAENSAADTDPFEKYYGLNDDELAEIAGLRYPIPEDLESQINVRFAERIHRLDKAFECASVEASDAEPDSSTSDVSAKTRKQKSTTKWWVALPLAAALVVLAGFAAWDYTKSLWDQWLGVEDSTPYVEAIGATAEQDDIQMAVHSATSDGVYTYVLLTATDLRHEGRLASVTSFGHISVRIDGSSYGTMGDPVSYDEVTQTLTQNVQIEGYVPNGEAIITVYQLLAEDPEAMTGWHVLGEGTWEMVFAVPSTVDAKTVKGSIAVGDATLTHVAVTPISIAVKYEAPDFLGDVSLTLNYRDGFSERIVGDNSGSFDPKTHSGTRVYSFASSNYAELKSIAVDGVEYPLA